MVFSLFILAQKSTACKVLYTFIFKKIQNTFAFDKTKGLEQVNIYISEKN